MQIHTLLLHSHPELGSGSYDFSTITLGFDPSMTREHEMLKQVQHDKEWADIGTHH